MAADMSTSSHSADWNDIVSILSTSVRSSASTTSSTSSLFVVDAADLNDQQHQAAAQQMKISLPTKFHALATMHLSFLLDLSGTGLSELLDSKPRTASSSTSTTSSSCSAVQTVSSSLATEFSAPDSGSRSSFTSLFGRRKLSKDHQKAAAGFGQSLTEQSINRICPVIEFLSRPENLCHEGLFRKAGQVDRQKALCDRLTSTDATSVFSDLGEFSVHDCASVLKSFLGDLPEPLLTEKYLTAYRQITDMNSDAKRLQTLQLLIHLLPDEHSTLLRHVLDLLHRVTAEPGNRMTSENLAILFVPHIVVPRRTPVHELQQTSAAFTGLVSFMIDHVNELFRFPDALVRDISLYYQQFPDCAIPVPGPDEDDNLQSSCSSAVPKKGGDADDDVLVTVVGFADRQASQQAAVELDTARAIAELFEHVSQLPDSAYKRRFLKQFNKSMGTPCSATPTKRKLVSFTQSFKKILKRKHKCGIIPAYDNAIAENKCNTPCIARGDGVCDTTGVSLDTPIKNLFGCSAPSSNCHQPVTNSVENIADVCRQSESRLVDLENRVTTGSGQSSKVKLTPRLSKSELCLSKQRQRMLSTTDVVHRKEFDGLQRNTGGDCNDGDMEEDKENMAAAAPGIRSDKIFLFHHTPSVVAMERIFAEQRLPTYVKPKGYISPLRYTRLMATQTHVSTTTVSAKP